MNIEKIDAAIDAVAEKIADDADRADAETIKALAELVTARALVETQKNNEVGWVNWRQGENQSCEQV